MIYSQRNGSVEPDSVRLRIGGQIATVQSFRPRRAAPPERAVAAQLLPAPDPPPDQSHPVTRQPGTPLSQRMPGLRLSYRPIIALVEAVPSGIEDLALSLIDLAQGSGFRCGVVSLEPQNRVASRLACTARSPNWCWQHAAPELFTQQGGRTIVTAPDAESGLHSEHIQGVLQELSAATDLILVDLGCRWQPGLFRPVLTAATHIWFVTRPGKWTAMEMRLEQAEFSGWTDVSRIRTILLGQTAAQGGGWGANATLPEPDGQAAREFMARELGGAHR